MALTLTLLGSVTFNTTSGTKTVTATPAVGDVPVIVAAHTGYTGTTAPTDNNGDGGGTYTLAQQTVKNASADRMQVWVRDVPIGVAASTVFTHAPGTTTGGGLAVIKVAGADKAGLTGLKVKSATADNQSASTTPTVSMGSAISTNNAVIGAVFSGTNSTTTVANNASYTEVFDNGYATPTSGLEVMTRNSGETGSSIAWGGTSSSAYGAVVIELDAAQLADVSTLTDDFQDGSIGAAWTTGNLFSSTSLGASATISESGGKARFAVNAGTYNASKGYVSTAFYDWASTNGAYFQLPTIPDTSAYCAIMFTARVDTSKLGVYVATNGLNIGIGDTTFGDRTAVSYNSSTMGWLRLRYDSTNTRWEGSYAPPSEDPPATWTVFGTFTDATVPTATQAKTGKLSLEVLAYGTIPSTAEYFAVESVSTGSGAAGAISGTSALTFTHSGAVTGTGTLAGTSTLAFSHTATRTATAALTGTTPLAFTHTATGLATGVLAGASALAFTPSGTIAATGVLAGTNGLVFTHRGTLGLVGASALTFTHAAPLTGSGALSGASALTFSHAAPITGRGTLAGSSSLAFTHAGTLGLVGTAPLAFTHAAAITGTGTLAGSSTLTFANTGTFAAPGLSGTASLAFTHLANPAAYAGDSLITFTHTATLTNPASGALTGTASLTFTHTATRTATSALVGTSGLTFTHTATRTATAALIGSNALALINAGALTGRGTLAGASTLAFTAAVNSGAPSYLAGTCSLTFYHAGQISGISYRPARTVASPAFAHGAASPSLDRASASPRFARTGSSRR